MSNNAQVTLVLNNFKKRQRTPDGRFFPTTPVTDEPSSSSSSSSSPAGGTSTNPTSPMTSNMRDRQTVVLFGQPLWLSYPYLIVNKFSSLDVTVSCVFSSQWT